MGHLSVHILLFENTFFTVAVGTIMKMVLPFLQRLLALIYFHIDCCFHWHEILSDNKVVTLLSDL